MPERRRTRAAAKVQRTATQTTLKDLFQRTNTRASPVEDMQDVHSDPVPPSLPPAPAAQLSKPTKPNRLYPIFVKRESLRDTVINLDDQEVIDISEKSDDGDLLAKAPLSSTRSQSPCSDVGHATSPSPSPSSVAPNDHGCESDTSLSHAGQHKDTHMHNTIKARQLNKRMLSLGGVAPLPSSCSQHVRGLQHSYTFTQASHKRNVFSNVSSSNEGTLEFLANCRQVDDIPSVPLGDNCRFLTSQQCEEYLQSLCRDHLESHPIFARLSIHREKTSLDEVELWTRRFRPRRANEVLGNEQRAIYLRDWLRALELQSQDRPIAPDVTTGKDKKQSTSKRVEPRGVKRPRVVRAVARKRGNKKRRTDSDDDLDDFVVFSDADEGLSGPPEDEDDEVAFCQRTLARLHRCDATDPDSTCPVASNNPAAEIDHTTFRSAKPLQTNFTGNLTNTLLITGPPGCGKTAAVYACAEELGWEVFEVYPGIGKRNGASLGQLIGDVGRNHIVQTIQRRAPIKMTEIDGKECVGLRGYLATRKTGSGKPSREAGTERQPISVEGEGPTELLPLDAQRVSPDEVDISEKSHGESDVSRPIVRQSLVLLEEVDILFKEDGGFWPAVVEFIGCCQRPVVMTCNDPGLVPVGDLPLQTVLVFEPCPSMVAARYLQCLSLREGMLVPHEDLMAVYESTHAIDGLDMPEGPLYPRTGPLPLPDLRRCITQLQMVSAGARHGSGSEMHPGDEAEGHVRRSGGPISAASRVAAMGCTTEREMWRQMKRQAEVMSRVDADLKRRGMCQVEVSVGEVGGGREEMGYVGLCETDWREGDELIGEEAIRHSRGGHEEDETGPMEASIHGAGREGRGFRARVAYQTRMVYALQDVVGPGGPRVPQMSVFLDYIPWVRSMVAWDEEEEERQMEGAGRGRRTRTSMRARGHVRTVGIGEGQRAVLLEGGLGII